MNTVRPMVGLQQIDEVEGAFSSLMKADLVTKTEFDSFTGEDAFEDFEVSERAARSQQSLAKLLQKSPYSCGQSSVPQSPHLSFQRKFSGMSAIDLDGIEEEEEATESSGAGLNEELWANILSYTIEVPAILTLAPVSKHFKEALYLPGTWHNAVVRIPAGGVRKLAPHLSKWIEGWGAAKKMVTPRSFQFTREVRRLKPQLQVEVAWRFDVHCKGSGMEVTRSGRGVRRIAEEDVVVLGDEPLVYNSDRPAYAEVILEKLEEKTCGDGVNEFGIGFTACEPWQATQPSLGAVAAEVPMSWVVDFAKSAVCLSVNNTLVCKGYGIGAVDLKKGDRVGVRVASNGLAIEVFINGRFLDKLDIPLEHKILVEKIVRLFLVVDLYGRAAEISRSPFEEPIKLGE